MRSRRITRFSARRSGAPSASGWRRFQLRGGAVLLVLAVAAIMAILVAAPLGWAFMEIDNQFRKWNANTFEDLSRVEEHWTSLPHLSPFQRGDEEHVQAYLKQQPLIIALLDRIETRAIWVRQGDRFVSAQENPDTQMYRRWFTQAEESQRFLWAPSEADNPEAHLAPSVVLKGDRWIALKRWRPGSDAVEEALRRVLGPTLRFRVGLRPVPYKPQPNAAPEPWGDEPRYQVDPVRVERSWFTEQLTSNAFHDWEICAIPTRADERAMRRKVWIQLRIAGGGSLVVGISLFLGLWLRYKARKKSLLDADRLASLTHSLKTPLAILKFRCDSIRLGRLSPEQVDVELIHLGEEVDHLTLVIENGLQAIHGGGKSGPQTELGPDWFLGVLEDIRPAFEAEGRRLECTLCVDKALGSAGSLRAALLTLLENALYHGEGITILETFRQRNRLVVRVSDQGQGLQPYQLDALGKPFQRHRQEGKEGFSREGQGLGISLMCQVAEREGWGLSFASAPGEGLTATLELRAVRAA